MSAIGSAAILPQNLPEELKKIPSEKLLTIVSESGRVARNILAQRNKDINQPHLVNRHKRDELPRTTIIHKDRTIVFLNRCKMASDPRIAFGNGYKKVVFGIDHSGQIVVVKTIRKNVLFQREDLSIKQAARRILNLPENDQIVPFIYFFDTKDKFYIVEPYYEEKDLCDFAFDGKLTKQPISTQIRLLLSIVEPAALLNTLNLVHGDIKPDNFFVKQNGKLHLGDCDTLANVGEDRRRRTLHAYLPPEHIAALENKPKPCDLSMDSWAIGCCLYEYLTDKNMPLPEGNLDELIAVIKDVINEPTKWNSKIEAHLNALTPPHLRFAIPFTLELLDANLQSRKQVCIDWLQRFTNAVNIALETAEEQKE